LVKEVKGHGIKLDTSGERCAYPEVLLYRYIGFISVTHRDSVRNRPRRFKLGHAMSQNSFTSHSVTREAAARLIAVTIAACERVGFEPVVAIVDAGGNLKAFERSDKSSFLAVNIAIDKAYTAASFGLSTAQWVDLLDDRGASNLRHVPRVLAAAGGFPIMEEGVIIGGLGISGGSWAQDQEAGEEALRNFGQ
jgi:uncharacterized protein GlcG (DUF336 family)